MTMNRLLYMDINLYIHVCPSVTKTTIIFIKYESTKRGSVLLAGLVYLKDNFSAQDRSE